MWKQITIHNATDKMAVMSQLMETHWIAPGGSKTVSISVRNPFYDDGFIFKFEGNETFIAGYKICNRSYT